MIAFVRPRKLGTVLGPDGMLRLVPGLVRAPDVSFLARGKLSRKKHRDDRIPSVAPDLAVEVISKGNTKPEIARKMVDYFAAGTRLAWVVDPKTMTVRVHTAPREWVVLGLDDVLDGGDVLPGFQLAGAGRVRSWKNDRTENCGMVPARHTLPRTFLSSDPWRSSPFSTTIVLRRRRGWDHACAPWPISGIYFGTSSWKYEGWLGSIYSPGRYSVAGQVLAEEVRGRLPGRVRRGLPRGLRRLQLLPVPNPGFLASALRSVTSFAPVRLQGPRGDHRPNLAGHARYGSRANRANGSFLDAHLFDIEFAHLLAPYRDRVAVLIFEFGTIPRATLSANEFIGRLDAFLGALPGGFRHAVEIRNPEYLSPGYFDTLSAHGIAHVFNAWTRMPDSPRRPTSLAPSPPISRSSAPAPTRPHLRTGRLPLQAVSHAPGIRPLNPRRTPADRRAIAPGPANRLSSS